MTRWLAAARQAEAGLTKLTKPTKPHFAEVSSVLSVLSEGPKPNPTRIPPTAVAPTPEAIATVWDAAEAFAKASPRIRALEALTAAHPGAVAAKRIAAAVAFVRGGWADQAVALDWPEIELFGLDPRAPWARLDRLGAAYLTGRVVAVTDCHVAYAGGAKLRRGQQAAGARLPWPDGGEDA